MKNLFWKRLTALFLALLTLATAVMLASCGDEDGETSSEGGTASTGTVSEDGTLVPTLEDTKEFDGQVLRVLSTYEESLVFCSEPFGASESNSEPVNEACLSRFALMEQTYGITVETEFIDPWDTFTDRVKNDYMTGTTSYDVISSGLITLASLATEGYLLDLYSIGDSYLNLNESWWDSAAHKDMTVGGKLYFATGDILILDDEYTTCMFYNKRMIEDNGLENPTELALEGKWTIDKMYEMAQVAAADGDDGVMDVKGNDTWGIVCTMFDTYKLVMGADAPQVVKNDLDLPELAMDREYNLNVFDKVESVLKDNTVSAVMEDFFSWDHPDADTVVGHFYSGKALFMIKLVSAVNSTEMREANIRYGILPMPKYDETQGNYATTNDPYRFYCISVMANCEDTAFVTFALEAMAYLGESIVTPEYYDRTLKYKRFPDDGDSPEILDLIFSNRLVDISVAFNWDDCIQYYNNIMFGNGDVVSYVESKRSAFEAAMQDTLEILTGLSAE